MLAGNCPIQLDGYVCTAWGGATCALRAGLVEAFGALKEKGDRKFWKESTVGIRSEVGYKTIIK